MPRKRPASAPPSARSTPRPIAKIKRKIARQATSAVSYELVPPAPDDPLLDFMPVPHARPRRNSITPEVQRAFIAQLAATGIVADAARHVGKSLEALYKLRQKPGAEGFRAAWDAAIDRGVSQLEDGALARAIQGAERVILHKGEIVAMERHHNEAMVRFFLTHRLPLRYGPQALVDSFAPGSAAYEALRAKLRAEFEAEKQAELNSPENREANKVFFTDLRERWRREWEAEQQRRERRPALNPGSGTPPAP